MADELVKVQLGGVFREPTFGARYHYLPRRIGIQFGGVLEPYFGRPIEDISAGAWLPSTIPLGVDLYATIDEEVASDTDYNYTTSASTFEVKLTALADPVRSTGHTIYFRVPAGFSPVGTLKVSLREGAGTEIAVAHNGTVTADTTYNYALSGAEADSITDYTDLRLRFEAS